MIKVRPPGANPEEDVGLIKRSNAVTVNKSFYCMELDWGGIESCDFESCHYRNKCGVMGAQHEQT